MTSTFKPRKVVCIFAHPDDEAFGPGATIAILAKTCEVSLICVTNGDADERFSNGYKQTELGKIRMHELEKSSEILGVKKTYFLGFKDGDLNNNNYHHVADKIKPILADIKPDTLLTFDLNGVSGHLDHVAVAMITSYLFERTDYIKRLLYYCEDEKLKDKVGNQYFVYFPKGHKRKDVDLVFNTKQVWATKLASMKAHYSQRQDCDWLLTNFREFLDHEYFRIVEKKV